MFIWSTFVLVFIITKNVSHTSMYNFQLIGSNGRKALQKKQKIFNIWKNLELEAKIITIFKYIQISNIK